MSEFVKMIKDGVEIDVHPLIVAEHQKLGWEIVPEKKAQPKAEAKAAPIEKPEKKPAEKKVAVKKSK